MKKLIFSHVAVFGCLAALCVFGCPVYGTFQVRCPGCGLTRAWLAFLTGDFTAALSQHALFLPMPVWLAILAHWETKHMQRHRRGYTLAVCLFTLALMAYHVLRTLLSGR